MEQLFNVICDATNLSIAAFNRQQQLVYSNNLLTTTWNIPPSYLELGLHINDFLEIVREGQVYPTQQDFNSFCQQIIGYFDDLIQPITTKLVTSNLSTYQQTIIPYNHGLIFIWEDISELSQTTYNLNNYKNLYSRVIHSLPLPIIIVGSSGIIENYNKLFCNFFEIDSSSLPLNEIRVSQLLQQLEPLHNQTIVTNNLLGLFVSRKEFSYSFTLANDITLEVTGFPLPNNQNFIIFRTLNSINPKLDLERIQASLQQLQTSLILELESFINTPLNTIIGIADILQEQYLGELNIKQKQYLTTLITEAETIKNDITSKVELTLYQNLTNLPNQSVDMNKVMVICLQQVKPQLKAKNININFVVNANSEVTTNYNGITKLITLTLFYLLEQNLAGSQIEILINTNPLTISFKDTSNSALFSPIELTHKFNLLLILKNLELLNGTYKIFRPNRNYRHLVFSFTNNPANNQ